MDSSKRQRENTDSSSNTSDKRRHPRSRKSYGASAPSVLGQGSSYSGFRAEPMPAPTTPDMPLFDKPDLDQGCQARDREYLFSQTHGSASPTSILPPLNPINAMGPRLPTNGVPLNSLPASRITLPGFNDLGLGQYSHGQQRIQGDTYDRPASMTKEKQGAGSLKAPQTRNANFEEWSRRTLDPLGGSQLGLASPPSQQDPGQFAASSFSSHQSCESRRTRFQQDSRSLKGLSLSQPPSTRNCNALPKLSDPQYLQPPTRAEPPVLKGSDLDDDNLTTLSGAGLDYPQTGPANDNRPSSNKFPCKWCSNSYSDKSGLNRHVDSEHAERIASGKPAPKKTQCGICKDWLTSPSAVERHQARRREISENIYHCPA